MTNPIANINGVNVYSDKRVASIVNTRVTFSDGSYADVSTGEVVNKGPGYINIGSLPGVSEKSERKTIQRSFDARNLNMLNLSANAKIEPHDGNAIEVEVTAPESQIDDISITQNGDTVVIENKNHSQGSGGMTVISSGGGSRVMTRIGNIRGGNVVVGGRGVSIVGGNIISGNNIVIGGNGEPETIVSVKVPKGSNLDISNVEGEVIIGDTLGNLRTRVSTSSVVRAGKVKKLNAGASSSGEVTVERVNGNASLRASSSGSITVNGGNIEELEASASSSGSIHVRATVQQAELEASSSGQVFANHVVNKPRTHSSSSGRVRVGNWQ